MIMAEQTKTFPTPVDWDELYPNRFIKATEFKGKKPTLTMTKVKIEELSCDTGPKIKGVISFKETDKCWALNKINGTCLKYMFGRKVQDWVGKRVTLFAGTWNGEEAVRVWGSPDIQADSEVTIALPRKRPFNMVMHAVRREGKRPETPAASPPAPVDAITKIRAAPSIEALVDAKKSIWASYASANIEVPIDVEAAAHEHREALESQS
jgi:hypothetical protein